MIWQPWVQQVGLTTTTHSQSIHHRDLQLDFLGDWFNWTHDTMSSVTSYRHTLIVNLITTRPIEYFFTNLTIDASEKNIIVINFHQSGQN